MKNETEWMFPEEDYLAFIADAKETIEEWEEETKIENPDWNDAESVSYYEWKKKRKEETKPSESFICVKMSREEYEKRHKDFIDFVNEDYERNQSYKYRPDFFDWFPFGKPEFKATDIVPPDVEKENKEVVQEDNRTEKSNHRFVY